MLGRGRLKRCSVSKNKCSKGFISYRSYLRTYTHTNTIEPKDVQTDKVRHRVRFAPANLWTWRPGYMKREMKLAIFLFELTVQNWADMNQFNWQTSYSVFWTLSDGSQAFQTSQPRQGRAQGFQAEVRWAAFFPCALFKSASPVWRKYYQVIR